MKIDTNHREQRASMRHDYTAAAWYKMQHILRLAGWMRSAALAFANNVRSVNDFDFKPWGYML